jgi:hypothetical protein
MMTSMDDFGDRGRSDDNWDRVFLATRLPGLTLNEPNELRGQKVAAIVAIVALVVITAAFFSSALF